MALTITLTLRKRHAFIAGGLAAAIALGWALTRHQQTTAPVDRWAQATPLAEALPPDCWRFERAGQRVVPASPETQAIAARIVAALPDDQRAKLPPVRVLVGATQRDELAACVTATGALLMNPAAVAPDERYGTGIQAALMAHQVARLAQGTAGLVINPPLDMPVNEVERLVLPSRIAADLQARELLEAAELDTGALYGYLARQYSKQIQNGKTGAEYHWRTRLKALWVNDDATFDEPMSKEAQKLLEQLAGGPRV